MNNPTAAPSHILILGSGAFGLSTAYALSKRPAYSKTRITVVSPELEAGGFDPSVKHSTPASFDTNRIVRADYADPLYAELAREAQAIWRTEEWGGRGRYHECGLLLTGEAYVQKAFTNVCSHENVRILGSRREVEEAMRAGPEVARASGDHGYINLQSGWVDAAGAMLDLEARVRKTGKVTLTQGRATGLITDAEGRDVRGARMADGSLMEADVTICAMGAWTASLINLSGAASCTAQVVAYFDITDDEASKLSNIPVHLNISTGCFHFPPNRRPDGTWEIKAARHFFGYANSVACPMPLGTTVAEYTPSLPSDATDIPPSDVLMLSDFLGEALPILGRGRQPRETRLCHYSDTQTGDFIVCPYPSFPNSLFIATGDSGHAFKMLPVLGERVVDVFSREDVNGQCTAAWAFPNKLVSDHVWCQDGSRGGTKGMTLASAMQA